jgi:quinohemoprotein ethanol dehydrogenase
MTGLRAFAAAAAAAALLALSPSVSTLAQTETSREGPSAAAGRPTENDAAETAPLPAIAPAPAFGREALVEPPRRHWPTSGGDWYNRRYSPLTEIDRGNVADLRGVWRARLDGSGVGPQYSGEAQPLVYDGVIYIVTGADDVFALSVDGGRRLWDYRANLDPALGGVICCGWTSRGVALGEGKVFVGRLDGKLAALDQRTGQVIWSVQAERPEDGFSITGAPLYYDGLVITGFAGAEYGIRGRVKAFDARDGSLVWTFYTVPGPGEPGHDTWPADNDVWMHGGGSVWQTPALDPELGLIFFSTGNPGPDYNGAVRRGDNLYTSSIVALDVKTGRYRWHFQQVHHDLWDYDGPSPVVLFDIELDGVLRHGLAQPSKTGWVYVLDRENGKPLIGIEERRVHQEPRQATAATQPYPVGDAFVPQHVDIAPEGYELVNGGRIFTPFWTERPVILKPAISGGVNWPPSSYDPAAGYLFVCAQDRIGVYQAEDIDASRPPPGELYAAGTFGASPLPKLGVFAAMDMRTNKLAWQQHWSDACYSGSAATAGGLVFVGRNDGRLTALDSSDGTKLWEFQTGAGMNSPVTVFEHDGHEYVVAYSAGNLFAGSARGDSVWLFGLDGELGPAPEATSIMTLPEDIEEAADAGNGRTVYDSACTFCHGEQGEGGHGGGPAFTGQHSLGGVIQIVSEGRNDMPAFGGSLSAEQIRDVAAQILELEASHAAQAAEKRAAPAANR